MGQVFLLAGFLWRGSTVQGTWTSADRVDNDYQSEGDDDIAVPVPDPSPHVGQ
jgi:hypothetical protein